jgi:DNA-binding transcriptional MerR regulator
MERYILLNREQAAAAARLEVAVVQHYADAGLISPDAGYGENDLADLRVVRRMMVDLELDHPAIEIILQMRRRMLSMQRELRQLQAHSRRAPFAPALVIDADWDDVM